MARKSSGQSLPQNARMPAGISIIAVALGAFAVGALAIGFLAINRLAVKQARIKRLEVDEVVVGRISHLPAVSRAFDSAPNS